MSQEFVSETVPNADSGNPPWRRPGLWTPTILTALCGSMRYLTKHLTDSPIGLMFMFWGPAGCFLLYLIWWLFFSRRTWTERLAGLGGAIVVIALSAVFSHPSMQMAMAMDLPFYMLVLWTLALWVFNESPWVRPIAVPLALLPAAFLVMSLRLEGITGGFNAEFSWRWTKKAEETYIASLGAPKTAAKSASAKPVELTEGDWPAFRGPNRDNIVRGAKVRTDWNKNPPRELWRHRIGPGWSSVAVVGERAFTQEQRGPSEAVVCFNLLDGKEVWSHVDDTRFEEPIAGPGPRATPTFADGRLFTIGGKGLLNAFDAATGEKLWSHDLVKEFEAGLKDELNPPETAADKKTAVPMWGFAGSPLVQQDHVIVYVGAKDKGVAVYNAADGKLVWAAGTGGHSYTSPHLATLAGVGVIVNTTNKAIQGLDPSSGKVLWSDNRELGQVVPCVQPSVHPGDRVALGTSFGTGTRVLEIKKAENGLEATPLATFTVFKPYFSDYVTIGDIGYGFDGDSFVCVDLKAGKKLWSAGKRYGSGQVLLLADQKLLLVVSEMDGRVVLVPADQSSFKEIGSFKALAGKTWNHPVLAHGKLIVRNGEEIACFDVGEK